jgi:ornithine carbamoyltransferase|tara:strand:- start:809 stop:1762 length:954 start_codon:yes stop_codon:yes gene_type:complete
MTMKQETSKIEHFISIQDLDKDGLINLIDLALDIKSNRTRPSIDGKSLALLFEKPSLRTRIAFELGMSQMDGFSVNFDEEELQMGKREALKDISKVLSRYVDAVAARVLDHKTLLELKKYSTVPVINALSDIEHPCQALADLMTIKEKKGTFKGLKLVFIGDGNNVASSLALACALVGINFVISSPPNYGLPEPITKASSEIASYSSWSLDSIQDPTEAVEEADIIYTDVWTSMGQESETDERNIAFKNYTITKSLLSKGKKDVLFLHDLPAHRGEEVEDGVIESPQSAVFDQAENRLHTQKALLSMILSTKQLKSL